LHRQGQGALYAGIKPAGSEVEPIVKEIDMVLESSSVDNLLNFIPDYMATETKQRFS